MKNILVTGASSGIGEAIVSHLRTKGHNVYGTSRNMNVVNADPLFLHLDVTDDASVDSCFQQLFQKIDKLDVLINNAGYGIAGPVEETTIEEAKAQFDTNFFGVVRMNNAVLPHMREQKGGLIINMGSLGGVMGLPFQAYYCASKFALQGYIEALRIEIRPFNIQALNILPGDFKSPFSANRVTAKGLSSLYRERHNNAMLAYEKEEENGLPPIKIAKLVQRLILKEKRYNVNYIITYPVQRFFTYLSGMVNSRLFESGLMKLYSQ